MGTDRRWRPPRWTIPVGIVLLVAAGVTTLHFAVHDDAIETGWSVPIDDTYIHFQYARGVAEGHPFAYHEGDGYSTGCTSPLYVLLLALPHLVGLGGERMVPVSLVLGGFWLACTMLLLLRVGTQLGSRAAGLTAAALWGCWGFAWYCLHSGMETGFYLTHLLAVASLFIAWSQRRDPLRPPWLLLVLASLLPLGRPDGLFLLVLLLSVVGLRIGLRRGAPRLRPLLPWAATVLPAAIYYLANRALTGSFSTAGMISKSLLHVPYMSPSEKAVSFASRLFEAVRHFLSGSDPNFLVFAVAAPGLAALVALGVRESRRRAPGARTVLAAWALVMLAAASMHYIRIARWERYYMPLFLLAILGAGFAVAWVARAVRRRGLVPALTLVLVLFQGDSTIRWVKAYERDLKTIHTKQAAAARTLKRRSPADARVLVCDAGAIPYISGRATFDIVGLTTPLRYNWFRNGVGSRFELFETIPAAERPGFVAAYGFCLWPGAHGAVIARHHDLLVAPVAEKQAGTGHRPVTLSGDLLDRIDIADLESEGRHAYRFHPAGSIRDNVVRRGRVGKGPRSIADGGRLIREWEEMTFHARPGRAVTLVGRFAAPRARLTLQLNGGALHTLKLDPTRPGTFTEATVTLPAHAVRTQNRLRVRTVTGAHYHSFHYFVLPAGDAPRRSPAPKTAAR